MSLTFGSGPLAPKRGDLNFSLDDAPKHQLLFDDYPRRMRAFVGEREVLDSTRGKLLHESNIAPVYYCPIDGFADDVLVDSELSTHCPFKGDASYWSLKVGDRVIEDAVWYYPEPSDAAPWLRAMPRSPSTRPTYGCSRTSRSAGTCATPTTESTSMRARAR